MGCRLSLLGHNGGPTMEAGAAWRAHCWRKARADLLPHLPIEVVRARVKRAVELRLDYKTYAGVRATTGRDIVAFLFSSNALRLSVKSSHLEPIRAGKLDAVTACGRLALAQWPVTPEMVLAAAPMLDGAYRAPMLLANDHAIRGAFRDLLGRLPADAVMLIGDSALEQNWCAAARLGSYLRADRYFSAS